MSEISDLKFFCTVAKHKSLAAAARALGLTPAATSKRLAALEGRLGVRLLNRTTRRTSVTQEGHLYFENGKRVLEEIAEIEASLVERVGLHERISLHACERCPTPTCCSRP